MNKDILEEYCKDMKIKVNYNIDPEFQGNEEKFTVAMWLASKKRNIPK